jgi:hypothetical protein
MNWVSRVWGGPFRTPPLQHPITVGWVLLKLLETIWRVFLLALVAIALLIGGIWFSQETSLSSQVKVKLSRATDYCRAKGWPIEAQITNSSRKTIGEIGLKFRVYPYGRSEDVAAYVAGSDRELHSIMRPGETLDWCFSMPQIGSNATGPFTLMADVTYASELPKGVPVTQSVQPPPIVTMAGPGTYTPPEKRTLWQKAGDVVGALVWIALLAFGGFGFALLGDRLFEKGLVARLNSNGKDNSGCLTLGLCALLNFLPVLAVSYALAAFRLYGWFEQIDQWSRSSGFADSGIMLVTAVASQWPWLLLLVVPRRADSGSAT